MAPKSFDALMKIIAALVAVIVCAHAARAAAPSYVILPNTSTLAGAHSNQQLLVERVVDQRFTADSTAAAKFTSSKTSVATVDEKGIIQPVGDGEATITASVDGHSASSIVQVI